MLKYVFLSHWGIVIPWGYSDEEVLYGLGFPSNVASYYVTHFYI